MRITISGRNIELTDGLKAAVEDKIGKLEKYFTPDTDVFVTLSVEKERQKIEVTIPVPGHIIRSEQVSNDMYRNWKDIKITQKNNVNNIAIDAGKCISVKCQVELPNIDPEHVSVECYYGKILENGVVEDISIIPMQQVKTKSKDSANSAENSKVFEYETKMELKTGGNYGYTFRVMPKHEMLLEPANMDLIKWITN